MSLQSERVKEANKVKLAKEAALKTKEANNVKPAVQTSPGRSPQRRPSSTSYLRYLSSR